MVARLSRRVGGVPQSFGCPFWSQGGWCWSATHHLITEAHGIPLAVSLTGGNRNDVIQLLPLIQAVPPVRGRRGRPRQRPDQVCADRGYDHDKYRQQVRTAGITPVSPAAVRSMARAWACTGGWLSSPSRCCPGSGGCGSAGRSATISTKYSSASPAASSAGATWPTRHFVRSSKCPAATASAIVSAICRQPGADHADPR